MHIASGAAIWPLIVGPAGPPALARADDPWPAPSRIKDHQKEQRSFLQRSAVAAACIARAGAACCSAAWCCCRSSATTTTLDLAQGNRARLEPIPANRGLILDRNGKVLAENQPSYQLELVREQVPDLEQTLKGLVAIDVIPADELDEVRRLVRARRGFETVPIRLRLTEEQIASFAVHRHQFPGVDIQARSTRSYPLWRAGRACAGLRGRHQRQ